MKSPKDRRILSRNELLEIINGIKNPRDRALICFLYLTGARISEALQVTKNDIEEREGYILINLPTLKKYKILGKTTLPDGRKKLLTQRDIQRRVVPINPARDQEFLDHIIGWFQAQVNITLFGFKSRIRAWQILHRYDLFPHYLRHLRLTHLVTERNFTDQDLIKFTGWADSKPAKYYIHLRWEDIAKKV